MHILMIAPQPFLEPRGTPISVYARLQMLSELGYQVDLLTFPVGSNVELPNMTIFRVASIPGINHVKVGPSWFKLLFDVLLFFKAIRLLRTNKYQVIHSHEEAAFFAWVLARLFHVRHIYDMHSSLPKQLDNFGFLNIWPVIKLFELLEGWAIRNSNAVITVGTDLEAYIKQIHPHGCCINIENFAVHHLVQNTKPTLEAVELSVILEGKLPIVYAGTLEKYQGLNMLFDSAPTVVEAVPEATFVIVGGKDHQVAFWQDYARRLGLAQHFVFVGQVTLDTSLEFLNIAEVLVSPRLTGTSVPLKIYSYMQAARAIVATRIPAHTQILDDETALLVEPNEDAFAEGVIKLLRSAELRHALGAKVGQVANERYDLARQASKLQSVYDAVLEAVG